MHPDDDPQLSAAFSEFHRRNREQAPSFEAMRDRAMRAACNEKVALPARFPILRWAACAMAVGGLIAVALWQMDPESQRGQGNAETAAAAQRVDQLIDRIEQHVEIHSAIALPGYPSDALLVSTTLDSAL